MMAVYLNTYEIHQEYGGPEEGGWWFECGEPVQSLLLSQDEFEGWLEFQDPEQLSALREKATLTFSKGLNPVPKNTGFGGYTFVQGEEEPISFLTDNNYLSCFEDSFAKPYPEEKPSYC